MQALETFIWNSEPIPTHQTITAAKNGGIILGAYDDDKLIGFSYGFAGFSNKKTYLCSHVLGIHPDYRSQGIGAALKEAQKEEAIKKGYDLITWTYDPLESVNGYLNLSKLKAICSTYIENCYGDMEDNLNQGLPSDRFQVEWWIQSEHLTEDPWWHKDEYKLLVEWDLDESGHPFLMKENFSLLDKENPLLVPIPSNFQRIKKEAFPLAVDWRTKTRKIFQRVFQEGYAAVELLQNTSSPVNYYVLVKRNTLKLGNERIW
ncbi:GNAT family N-acetyltransferase [Calidifontibacillus erzurumensis]